MSVPVDPTYPRIIQFTGMHDGGPCDDGPTNVCPHCGADGRYVYFFKCDDGKSYGAMAGCIQKFPVSPVAKKQEALIKKQHELRVKYGKDAHLNSWQTKMMEIIDLFQSGGMDEATALSQIAWQETKMAQYRASKRR